MREKTKEQAKKLEWKGEYTQSFVDAKAQNAKKERQQTIENSL